jgi:hypothetical protein
VKREDIRVIRHTDGFLAGFAQLDPANADLDANNSSFRAFVPCAGMVCLIRSLSDDFSN